MEKIRLNSYIAKCGVASRRKADLLIKEGLVFVNGKRVLGMGLKVSENDEVKVNGDSVKIKEEKIYILLNKPVGVICSSKDQFDRVTVMDIIGDMGTKLHTVGRLDYDTSGIIILTNDGDLTYKLTHPKYHIEKTYLVKIKGCLTKSDKEQLEKGIVIDGYKTLPAKIDVQKINNTNTNVEIKIYEGKNRQIRKMFSKLGYDVIKLKRIKIGDISIGNLKEGKFINLSKKDIINILKI
jgi:23S rRNA pseudouridine2605 synthase